MKINPIMSFSAYAGKKSFDIAKQTNLKPLTKNTVSFGSYERCEEEINGQFVPLRHYEKSEFNAEKFLDVLSKENSKQKYIYITYRDEISPNRYASEMLEQLETLKPEQQKDFVSAFCEKTGFPNFKTVKQNMEEEISSGIHKLAKEYRFNVDFIGYDKNCSLGRETALPGSDCDALFMIVSSPNIKDDGFYAGIRWRYKDNINQRLVNTPADGLPEVLSTYYIQDGLKLADEAFKKADFSDEDFVRFENNLQDNSNDFVKASEFNIRLAKQLPSDTYTREKFYKTAMLVELVREGAIVENNFTSDFINSIRQSPLYKYSNIIRGQGLSHNTKNKYEKRLEIAEKFDKMASEEQFSIVKDIVKSSLGIKNTSNDGLFANKNADGESEMGNILEMYNYLYHAV